MKKFSFTATLVEATEVDVEDFFSGYKPNEFDYIFRAELSIEGESLLRTWIPVSKGIAVDDPQPLLKSMMETTIYTMIECLREKGITL